MASSPEPDRASEFTHFQQTYGPALLMPQRSASFASSASLSTSTATDGVLLQGEPLLHSATTAERRAAKTADDCTKESSVFVWELLLYIPILLQSLFGSLHIVRSLALGWLIQQASTRAPGWLGFQHLEELVRKIDTHAWPPPALLFLAVLTITALVVHPDGFTWVLLRKLRDAMISLFRASCVCWSMVLNEHGAIISTALALMTFASLFFLVYLLHRTLTPRPNTNQRKHPNSKAVSTRKKKRKGHGRGHRSGRTRTNATQRTRHEEILPVSEQQDAPKESIHEPSLQPVLPAVLEDLPVDPPPVEPADSFADSLADTVDAKQVGAPSRSRDRAMSSSTVDSMSTTSTVGDQSCESGRSTPTQDHEPATTTPIPVSKPVKQHAQGKASRHPTATPSTRKNQNRRRGRKPKEPRSKESKSSNLLSTSSRWDALKPENRADARRTGLPGHLPSHHSAAPSSRSPPPRSISAPGPSRSLPPAVSPFTVSLRSCEKGVSEWKPKSTNSAAAVISPPRIASVAGQQPPKASSLTASSSLLAPIVPTQQNQQRQADWNDHTMTRSTVLSAPPGLSPPGLPPTTQPYASFSASPLPPAGFSTTTSSSGLEYTTSRPPPRRIKSNPFADDDNEDQLLAGIRTTTTEDEDQIEQELQELGGRMIGSILDF